MELKSGKLFHLMEWNKYFHYENSTLKKFPLCNGKFSTFCVELSVPPSQWNINLHSGFKRASSPISSTSCFHLVLVLNVVEQTLDGGQRDVAVPPRPVQPRRPHWNHHPLFIIQSEKEKPVFPLGGKVRQQRGRSQAASAPGTYWGSQWRSDTCRTFSVFFGAPYTAPKVPFLNAANVPEWGASREVCWGAGEWSTGGRAPPRTPSSPRSTPSAGPPSSPGCTSSPSARLIHPWIFLRERTWNSEIIPWQRAGAPPWIFKFSHRKVAAAPKHSGLTPTGTIFVSNATRLMQ